MKEKIKEWLKEWYSSIIMVAVIIAMGVIITVAGVTITYHNGETPEEINDRFIAIQYPYSEKDSMYRRYYSIMYDKETKVMYSVSKDGVFTVLVDENGNPVTYKGE